MLAEAFDIVMRQPRTADLHIFLVTDGLINGLFSRACKAQIIVDLRFHDLRHEGILCLFEQGSAQPSGSAMIAPKRGQKSIARIPVIFTLMERLFIRGQRLLPATQTFFVPRFGPSHNLWGWNEDTICC